MPSCGIVGAGAAGLRAAQVLQAANINVTVLEARDTIGGRVRFFSLRNALVEQLICYMRRTATYYTDRSWAGFRLGLKLVSDSPLCHSKQCPKHRFP